MRSFAIFLLVSVSCWAQSFTKTDYAVGSHPMGIASADFNRDGVTDLAIANAGDSSISILLGHADGTFASASSVAVAASPKELVVADFNSDGIPDLATAGSAVTILLGNGDGTFRRGDISIAANSISSADFNGDSKADLAVASGGKVQILNGLGDGTFGTGAQLKGDVPFAVVRVADLNRDGAMDLAIGACCQGSDVTYGAVYSAIGDGDGTFTVAKLNDQSDGQLLTVADLTRDGLPDLILPYQGCHTPCVGVEVETNQGNNTFQRFGGEGLDTLRYVSPGHAAVADFNGDGILDVAVPFGPGDYETTNGNSYDKVLVFSGSGDGKFSGWGDYAAGKFYGPFGIVAADFNHDGKADMAVTDSRSNNVTVFLNNTGSAADKRNFDLSVSPASQTVTAGNKAQLEYYLDPTNGKLPSDMQLSCSGLPQGASCAFDPVQGQNAALGFVTIQTVATTSALPQTRIVAALALLLPFGFVAIPGDIRKRSLWIALLVLCFGVMLQLGCAGVGSSAQASSGGSNSNAHAGNGTGNAEGNTAGNTGTNGSSGAASSGSDNTGTGTGPDSGSSTVGGSGSTGSGSTTSGPGNYRVTITATGGGITHTQTVSLTVQ